MNDAVAATVIAVSVLVGGAIVVLALLDRRPIGAMLGGLLLVELAALVQVLVVLVALLRGERPDSGVVFTGYALASLLVPPIGALWALSERTKWGTAAAGVSCLVLAVATLRLQQLWS